MKCGEDLNSRPSAGPILTPDQLALMDEMVAHQGFPVDWTRCSIGQLRRQTKAVAIAFRTRSRAAVEHTTLQTAHGPNAGPLKVFKPPGASGSIFFIHGGGWTLYDTDVYTEICRELAGQSGATVYASDYPKAPEHPFPSALGTLLDAYRCIADRERMTMLVGDSAGANLAFALSNLIEERAACPHSGIVSWYGVFDPLRSGPSHRTFGTGYGMTTGKLRVLWSHYLKQSHDASNPLVNTWLQTFRSPFPVRLTTAEADPCRSDSDQLALHLEAQGFRPSVHMIGGAVHGCMLYWGRIGSAARELSETASWIRKRLDLDL